MPKRTILVVDDEPRMRELIRLYLQAEYTVNEARDGLEALKQLSTAEPDLVILDVMMPKLDGWATLERIRAESSIPVIMLTARGEVPDRVHGLRLGADDYMAKPFDGRELVARVEAHLRRAGGPAEGQTVIRRGALLIHPAERTVTWTNRAVPLTPREFDLLTLLAAYPGQVFPRDRLLDRVWGSDYEGDFRTVDSHIKNLREKLGDGAGMIATVWGVGYRFVEEADAKA
ncbi:MAG TPA: response regulator transcription factor [Symbiobacteriaceae bacterium]|jgi:two-component system response regulator ResD